MSAITAGAGNFFFGGGDHLAAPGTLVVVAPGEVHAHSHREGGRSFRSLSVPSSLVGVVDFPSSVIADERIFRVFLRAPPRARGLGNPPPSRIAPSRLFLRAHSARERRRTPSVSGGSRVPRGSTGAGIPERALRSERLAEGARFQRQSEPVLLSPGLLPRGRYAPARVSSSDSPAAREGSLAKRSAHRPRRSRDRVRRPEPLHPPLQAIDGRHPDAVRRPGQERSRRLSPASLISPE